MMIGQPNHIDNTPAECTPQGALDLIWNQFFVARARGISLRVHFPWLFDHAAAGRCHYHVTDRGIASCAMTRDSRPRPTWPRIRAIGLVCTADWARRQGIASAVLDDIRLKAAADDIDALLLWASAPAFYQRLGFEPADTAVYGQLLRTVARGRRSPLIRRIAPDASELLTGGIFRGRNGVPPFANTLQAFAAGSETEIIVDTTSVARLVASRGDLRDVAEIIGMVASTEVVVNAYSHDGLYEALVERGWSGSLAPRPLAMWHLLSPQAPPVAFLSKLSINVVDRF